MTRRKPNRWIGNVRDAALSILIAVRNEQAYSNLLLHQTIKQYQLDSRDRALLTELTYGTIQRRLTIDYFMAPFVRSKLEVWVEELLRLSVYQLVYLTKIPSRAVVHEAVNIAKKRGHAGIAATVNAILRSFLRQERRSLAEIQNDLERLAVETSHPLWLIERWQQQYGLEATKKMAMLNNEPPQQMARVNRLKCTVEDVITSLEKEGFDVECGQVVPQCIRVNGGNLATSEAFLQGWLTIQDESAMLPALALDVHPKMKVLDMCAAPGGKTTHLAELMEDQGSIYAHDLHPHKLTLIEQQAERLGIQSITTVQGDSRQLITTYPKEFFDRILVDAPCSGLGVIRRKPELKYTKTLEDSQKLSCIQLDLLKVAAQLLKKNGFIVYSTCTVEAIENEQVVAQFLTQHPEMEVVPLPPSMKELLSTEQGTLQLLPQHFNSDGFFIAIFQKKS